MRATFVVFVVVPRVDHAMGKSTVNPDPGTEEALSGRVSFRVITWACVPVTAGLVPVRRELVSWKWSFQDHPVRNRVLHHGAIQVALVAATGWVLGWLAAAFLLIQAVVVISLLEVINYIEHYGMSRALLPDGHHEPVRPVHSWNSSNRLTNYFLFNLQRHSDHHYKPGRRYQLLRHFNESPQLPTGYAGMVVLALVPPLFKRVLHPVLDGLAAGRES